MLFTKAFVGLFSLLFLKYSTSCHYIRVYIIYKANSSSTRYKANSSSTCQLITKQIARQLVNLSTRQLVTKQIARQLVNLSTRQLITKHLTAS